MKNIKEFYAFLNEGLSYFDNDILKSVKFRDHDLDYWLNTDDDDNYVFKTASDKDKAVASIESLIEQFEIHHQDEFPDQVMKNKINLTSELLAMFDVCMQFQKEINSSVFQVYISDYAVYSEEWKSSKQLVDFNDRTGALETLKNLKNYSNFLNENVQASFSSDILDKVQFQKNSLNYWLSYADKDPKRIIKHTIGTTNLYQHIEKMVNRVMRSFEYDGDEHYPYENPEKLKTDMIDLGKILILFTGELDEGCLSAYCSQFSDTPVWAQSPTLVKTNDKIGVFEQD